VSSCDSADDRRRAEDAGARAYIVKGEFDQGQFLSTIRQLIG
jgi:two-component system chemotaxis sensor kinase CheA